MKAALALLTLFVAASTVLAAPEEELTPYTLEEIEDWLKSYNQTYKNKKLPEDDAITAIENLRNAYRYLDSMGVNASKDELKAKKKIVTSVAKGLKARKRPLVTLECARALGEMPEKAGGKALLNWMENTVLDAKSPNPQWVEYGFRSMAWIGGQDKSTLDLLRSYATGKHVDIGVASQALAAVYQWRELSGKNRQELFDKILGYLGSLHSNSIGGDPKKRATYAKRWNTVKDEGLKALRMLSGESKGFADPAAARDWWKDNKRRRWDTYVGPKFRKKAAPKKEEEEGA